MVLADLLVSTMVMMYMTFIVRTGKALLLLLAYTATLDVVQINIGHAFLSRKKWLCSRRFTHQCLTGLAFMLTIWFWWKIKFCIDHLSRLLFLAGLANRSWNWASWMILPCGMRRGWKWSLVLEDDSVVDNCLWLMKGNLWFTYLNQRGKDAIRILSSAHH
jgi:hypothetical protein